MSVTPISTDPNQELTLAQCAKILGMSTGFVRGLVKAKSIRHVKLGRKIKIFRADADAYLLAHTVEVSYE